MNILLSNLLGSLRRVELKYMIVSPIAMVHWATLNGITLGEPTVSFLGNLQCLLLNSYQILKILSSS